MKIRKGDTVLITAGKDKGKKGKVERVYPDEQMVLVPGLNLFKRHLKKRTEGQKGGIVTFSRPINMANVAIICPKCSKPTRVGFQLSGDDKIRICRKCQQPI